jgi:hypothetical protein
MNSNLDISVSLEESDVENTCLHDEEAVKDLYGVQDSLNEHSFPLSQFFAVSSYREQ